MPIHLPPELVCEIFLHAARSSSSFCRTLCEVSTWTRDFALPHLYATVAINTTDSLAQFLLSLRTLKTSTQFHRAHAVRHVWISIVSEGFEALIQRCPNISHLAFDGYNFRRLVDADATLRRGPRDADRGPDLDVLMLHNGTQNDWTMYCYSQYRNINTPARITHLRLGDPVRFETQLWLGHMRRLTHLAVPCGSADTRDLKHVLLVFECRPVKVIVLIVSEENIPEDKCREVEDWVCATRAMEKRIYVARPLCDRLQDEWEAEVRGGKTVWERAVEYTQLLMDRV